MQRFVVAMMLGLVISLAWLATALAAEESSPSLGAEQQGCDIAVARTAGTAAASHVQAACNLAHAATSGAPVTVAPVTVAPTPVPAPVAAPVTVAPTPVPVPVVAPVSPVDGVKLGCGIAVAQTAGTPGAPFVQAGCNQALNAVGAAPVPPVPTLNHSPALAASISERNIAILAAEGVSLAGTRVHAAWCPITIAD